MYVETSVGDLLDKMTILELKQSRIRDPAKLAEITRELATLAPAVELRDKYSVWYGTLFKLNAHIWDLTDEIKARTVIDESYARNAHKIMDFNQRRFRIKNVLNLAEETSLKEQKSYPQTSVTIEGDDISCAVYAATVYDKVFLRTPRPECVGEAFGVADPSSEVTPIVIPEDEAHLYDFRPFRYVSGGMIGDFIHQLSVVYETYRKTGRKGHLFIDDRGGPFRRGLLPTFNDIREVIEAQPYIASFSVYQNEPVDVDLSRWRGHPTLYHCSWAQIFRDTYGVPWGTKPWMTVVPDTTYRNVSFLSMTSARACADLDFKYIMSKLPGTAVFLETEDGQVNYFMQRFNLTSIPVLRVYTFQQLARAIAGCHTFVGTLSMPLALADALGVNRIALMPVEPNDRGVAVRTPKPYIYTMEDAYSLL